MNAILIIDPQYDFCDPKGALYVKGAEDDMSRLADWITRNTDKLKHISVTLDSHHPNDISHPAFWQDENGKFPGPFTAITSADVKAGKWTPRFYPPQAIKYLEDLEAQGEFPHLIWPTHCLIGHKGSAIFDPLFDSIAKWTTAGNFYNTWTKGTYPLTEHFGIFRAQVPDSQRPETQLNQPLIKTLEQYQTVFLAGEAKDYCVATSLKQVMEAAPALAQKVIVLDDCMSNVSGSAAADKIYADALALGVKFEKSTNVTL
jgi:nicotinamidase/pyrazinamidase